MNHRYILINTLNKTLFNAGVRDNCNEPYLLLRDKLNTLGYKVELANRQSIKDCEWIFFF